MGIGGSLRDLETYFFCLDAYCVISLSFKFKNCIEVSLGINSYLHFYLKIGVPFLSIDSSVLLFFKKKMFPLQVLIIFLKRQSGRC